MADTDVHVKQQTVIEFLVTYGEKPTFDHERLLKLPM